MHCRENTDHTLMMIWLAIQKHMKAEIQRKDDFVCVTTCDVLFKYDLYSFTPYLKAVQWFY